MKITIRIEGDFNERPATNLKGEFVIDDRSGKPDAAFVNITEHQYQAFEAALKCVMRRIREFVEP